MSQARHIAFIAPRFAGTAEAGGAETLLKRLAQHTLAAGLRVSFLTTCARDHFTWINEIQPGRRTVDGLDVRFFPVDENRDLPSFLQVQTLISRGARVSEADEMVWLRNNVNSEPLQRHLREDGAGYDRIVIGPYLFGLTFFAAEVHPSRTILVPCLHDEPFAYLASIRTMFRRVGGFMFNSEPEQALAVRLFGLSAAPEGGRRQRSAVVGMGLDSFEADPKAFAAKRGLGAPYLIYSGRREPLKGTPLLIGYLDAFRQRTGRDIKLVLTGSGAVDLPSSLAPHVVDAGFLPENDKHDAMAGALAFCHPSVNESLGIVILESWLAGTPVLVHARSEVLRDHCRRSNGGLWFRNYPEFEEEVLMLMDRPPVRQALAAAGKSYVEQTYSWRVIEPKLLDALGG